MTTMASTAAAPPLPEERGAQRRSDSTGSTGTRGAWQRELERAKLTGWFQPMLQIASAPAEARAGSQRQAAASVLALANPRLPSVAAVASAPAPATVPGQGFALSGAITRFAAREPAMPQQLPPLAAASINAEPQERSPAGTPLAAARPPMALNAAAGARRADPAQAIAREAIAQAVCEPVRVHAQTTDGGVCVWLGLDGSAAVIEQQATAIVGRLRDALHEQGQRLSAVVCNGRVMYLAAGHSLADSFHPQLQQEPS